MNRETRTRTNIRVNQHPPKDRQTLRPNPDPKGDPERGCRIPVQQRQWSRKAVIFLIHVVSLLSVSVSVSLLSTSLLPRTSSAPPPNSKTGPVTSKMISTASQRRCDERFLRKSLCFIYVSACPCRGKSMHGAQR